MSWSGKRVLVTGGGGFIGSHLCQRLALEGASVRALVHYRFDGSHGWLDELPESKHIEVLAGDIRDRESVAQAMRDQEVVFHLAALISIPSSYQSPSAFFLTNAMGTMNVLLEARAQGTGKVVHQSSSEVYGSALYLPMNESHPLVGQSPYAASKIAADKAVESFHLSYGVPVVTARPFNCYGPQQSERAVVPSIIVQALRGGPIKLASCDSRRDFTFVADMVSGLLQVAEKGTLGKVYNLATGTDVSTTQLAGMVQLVLGTKVPIEVDEKRDRPGSSEVTLLCGDALLATVQLGWWSKTGLEEGLEVTTAWFREHLGRYSGKYAI